MDIFTQQLKKRIQEISPKGLKEVQEKIELIHNKKTKSYINRIIEDIKNGAE